MDPYLCNGFTCVKFAMWPHAGFSVVKSPNARFTFHHMAKTRVANLFQGFHIFGQSTGWPQVEQKFTLGNSGHNSILFHKNI